MKKRISAIILALGICITNSLHVFADTTTSTSKGPDLVGKSAISYDLDTKELIYTKNIDQKSYPASITKLLTALIFAENKTANDTLTYTQSAFNQPPYSYRLNVHPVNVGAEISAKDAMDALLLFSGNDIAYMIADNVSGDATKFSEAMNKKAKELKMNNSNFITPNGLDDGTTNHYTTAYDLTKLAEACYNNPWVKESMAKKESQVSFINGSKAVLTNRNKLVQTDGCIGGKTGYTQKAGRCLVALYERNGRHLVGVVMNSNYNYPQDTIVFDDMKKLMDWSFSAKKDTIIKKNATLTTVKVPYKVLPLVGPTRTLEVPVQVNEDITYYSNDLKPEKQFKFNTLSAWNLSKDKSIGTLKLTQKDNVKEFKVYPTISKIEILKDNILIYSGVLLVVVVLILGIVFLIRYIGSRRNFY